MSAVVKTDIDRLIAEYRDGYTLPQAFYRAADIFAHDMESLIFRRWLLVGHESRIPNQGDYFLLRSQTSPSLSSVSPNRGLMLFLTSAGTGVHACAWNSKVIKGCSPALTMPGPIA